MTQFLSLPLTFNWRLDSAMSVWKIERRQYVLNIRKRPAYH